MLLSEIAPAPATAMARLSPPSAAEPPPAMVTDLIVDWDSALTPTSVAVTTARAETSASVVLWMSFDAIEIANARPTAGGPRAKTIETPPASAVMFVVSLAWTLRSLPEMIVPPEICAFVVFVTLLPEPLPAPAKATPPPEPVETEPAMPMVSAKMVACSLALIVMSAPAPDVRFEFELCAVTKFVMSLRETAAAIVIDTPVLLLLLSAKARTPEIA
jgi:hypothetical protein